MEPRIGRLRIKIYQPYVMMAAFDACFLIAAFILEKPSDIWDGFRRIVVSRSVLVTDYIAVGGVGATLLNVSVVGLLSIFMLTVSKVKPSGAIIMALWLTAGFAFFGKNIFNMLPLTVGVWLFAKYNKEPFGNYSLSALLVATLCPAISEITFMGRFGALAEITAGVLLGFVIGFIFPPISAETVKMHGGYDLYNMGFAGGLIALIAASGVKGFGIDILPADTWSAGNNAFFAPVLYGVSAAVFLCGLFIGGVKKNLAGFRKIFNHSGRLITDYYFLYENSAFINMGVLCAFATTLTLLIGAELNGVAIAGIFTIMGFGSFGKHLKNIAPVVAGAILAAYFNRWDFVAPVNVAAILFSTGLAPIAGQFGWVWGVLAGLLHVNVAMYAGTLSDGINLYSNGFAACFVAIFIIPLATAFKKQK